MDTRAPDCDTQAGCLGMQVFRMRGRKPSRELLAVLPAENTDIEVGCLDLPEIRVRRIGVSPTEQLEHDRRRADGPHTVGHCLPFRRQFGHYARDEATPAAGPL